MPKSQNVIVERGWHDDPDKPGQKRYWDGKSWTGVSSVPIWQLRPGRMRGGHYSLSGWRRIWFSQIVRFPIIFYPLSWFDNSVPLIRGHLGRVRHPREMRELLALHHTE
jgi:hypothetical protein